MAVTISKLYLKQGANIQAGNTNTPWSFTPRGAWDRTSDKLQSSGDQWRYHDSLTSSGGSAVAGSTSPSKTLVGMIITDPLEAEAAYSGTMDVVLRTQELLANNDDYWYVHVWVTQGDSDAVRATLLSDYSENTTNEWPTTATGTSLQAPQTLSGAWQRGDRIVFELGFVQRGTSHNSVGSIFWGSRTGTADLTVGSTSALNGFITLSSALTLVAPDANLLDGADTVALPYDQTFEAAFGGGESEDEVDADRYVPVFATNLGTFWGFIDHPIWLKWTATYTGTLYLSTEGSGGDVTAAAWEDVADADIKSGALDNLNSWAFDSFSYPTDATPGEVPVTSGKTYTILLGFDQNGSNWPQCGDIRVKLQATPFAGASLENDECSGAEVLSAGWFDSFSTATATDGVSDPLAGGEATLHKTVWFTWTATYDSVAIFRRVTEQVTQVVLCTGTCGGLTPVAESAQATAETFQWNATAGTTYYLMLGSVSNDAGGLFTGEFHVLAAMTEFSASNMTSYRPDEAQVDGIYPFDADADEWFLDYARGTPISTWTTYNSAFINLAGGNPMPSVNNEVVGLCGSRLYTFRIRPYINIDGVIIFGPEARASVQTHQSRALYIPNGSIVRTYPMNPGGMRVGVDSPLGFSWFGCFPNAACWAKFDGTGGDVTIQFYRCSTPTDPFDASATTKLTLDTESWLWFGIRDYKLAIEVRSDQVHDASGPVPDQIIDRQLFQSTATVPVDRCCHVAFSATVEDSSIAAFDAGWTWRIRFFINGEKADELTYTSPGHSNLFYVCNGSGGSIFGPTGDDLVWTDYQSFGGIQEEDGSPSELFTDTGGVTLSRWRTFIMQGLSEADELQHIVDEMNSCETAVHPAIFPAATFGPELQLGLWGTSPTELHSLGMDSFGSVEAVASCCSCGGSPNGTIGPLAWVEWYRR